MAADDRNIENGVWTVELKCNANPTDLWREFDDLVCARMSEYEKPDDHICWRGQPTGGELSSLFDRMLKDEIPDALERQEKRPNKLGDHRRSCAYAFRGVLQNPSVRELKQAIKGGHLNENHFWAVGRHYDLATPLLDWTLSPFVAAFFASEEERKVYEKDFEEKSKQWFDKELKVELKKCCKVKSKKTASDHVDTATLWEKLKRELFPNHRLVCALKYKKLQEESEKPVGKTHTRKSDDEGHAHMRKDDTSRAHRRHTDVPRNLKRHRREDDPAQIPYFQYLDPLSCEHLRLLNQKGIFTLTPNGEGVAELVESLLPGEREEWILLKIRIPSTKDVREEFLKHLNWMNINHLSLFPDLLGASKYSNRELERALARRQS